MVQWSGLRIASCLHAPHIAARLSFKPPHLGHAVLRDIPFGAVRSRFGLSPYRRPMHVWQTPDLLLLPNLPPHSEQKRGAALPLKGMLSSTGLGARSPLMRRCLQDVHGMVCHECRSAAVRRRYSLRQELGASA